jgi:hypothetical protein
MRGFDCVMEYLYTTKVRDVTYGIINKARVKAALQCAKYLGVLGLHERATEWAEQCGINLEH